MRTLLSAASSLLVNLLLTFHAQASNEAEIAALKGEGPLGIDVLVDVKEHVGLSQHEVKTVVELRFRAAGLDPVASSPDTEIDFYITVQAFGESLCPFAVRAHTRQLATLRSGRLFPIVWDRFTYGTIGCERLGELKEDVVEVTDEFLNDYLKANPRGNYRAQRQGVPTVPAKRSVKALEKPQEAH